MSNMVPFGRTRNSGRRRAVLTLAVLATAGLAMGLVWAGQATTVRVCEDPNPAVCDGADARFQHSTGDPNLGFSIAMGYLNGDGFIDLVMGAPNEARVYVFFGAVDANVAAEGVPDRSTNVDQADVILQGEIGSEFGYSVAIQPFAVNLNNPIIVGAPRWTDGVTTPGRAYVVPAAFWNMPPTVPTDIGTIGATILTGEADGDEAGYAVGIGPVLAAGAADRIVTARLANGGVGAVYAVAAAAGSINLSMATTEVAGNAADMLTFPVAEGLGEFVAIADFPNNGDGRLWVAVGAVGVNGTDTNNIPGHVYIFDMLNAPPVADAAHRIVGEGINDFFGFSIAGGELIAGAGPELVVGAIYSDRDNSVCDLSDRTNVGAAYVFNSANVAVVATGGGPLNAIAADTIYRGHRNWDEFGFALAIGKADHSGLENDLAISARRHDRDLTNFNQLDEGAVYLFEGPLAAGEQCMDCPVADCSVIPAGVDAMIFGGDYSTAGSGASDEIGFSLAFGEFNGADLAFPAGRLFDDIAVSSVTQERVYLVSLQNLDNPAVDGGEADAFRDIEDRDDDGDGYDDTDEDFNRNGMIDVPVESDPLTPNRDVTVSVTTNAAGDNLDCAGQIEVTVTVSNVSRVLTLIDPQLRVTLPGAPFEYVAASTEIYRQGVLVSAVNDDPGPTFPFSAGLRSITQTGTPRTLDPLAPTPNGQAPAAAAQIEVRFLLRTSVTNAVPVKLDWPTAQINFGDVDALVSLVAPDINELPFPHDAGISQSNNATRRINLRRPNLDIAKSGSVLVSDSNGELNPANVFEYVLTISNGGNLAATNVVVTDAIQANATIDVSFNALINCPSCSSTPASVPATDPLVVTLDTIDAGTVATITFRVIADETVANNDTLNNQATIAETCLADRLSDSTDVNDNDNIENGNDPGDPNDDDVNVDPIIVVEDITLTGGVAPNPAVVGDLVTYTFQATTGTGTVRLSNVTLTDTDVLNPAKCVPASTPVSGDNFDGNLDWAETGNGAETWVFTCTYTVQGTDPVSPPLIDSSVRITATTPQGNPVQADFNAQLDVDNTAPVANNDPSATADYNQIIEIDVLANDTDVNTPSGDLVNLQSVDAVTTQGGAAMIVACGANPLGCIRYTTPADVGLVSDTFQYTVVDNFGLTNSATVSVAIGAPPTLTINDVTLAEGTGPGDTAFVFTVMLTGNTGRFTVDVNADTVDGSAEDENGDGDYQSVSTTLIFPADTAGPQMMNVIVNVDQDNSFEIDETFNVVLSLATHATVTVNTGLGTIQNDDGTPMLSIDDVRLVEGDAGQTNMVFTVTKAGSTDLDFTVDFATTDGTATTADNDYVTAAGTLSFLDVTASLTVSVPIVGDMVEEPDQDFTVTLSNVSPPPRATISDGIGVGTIQNDELSLSIGDVTAFEGDAGTIAFAFDVTLSGTPTGYNVAVDWASADGTATTADSDYMSTGGTVTFTDGTATLTQQVMVLVNGDMIDEADEIFTVELSNEMNAVITTASGVGTIRNDDLTLSIDDISFAEGDAGTTNATFTVALSASPSGHDVTVDWASADGTATTADSDYTSTGGTVTFTDGTATLTQQVTVLVNGDMTDEPNETFDVGLSNAGNAIIGTSVGTATIQNDELNLIISDVSIVEGDAGPTAFDFIVTLSASPTGHAVDVQWASADATAEDENGDDDYASDSGALNFADGTATLMQTVTVQVNGDTKFELAELFNVVLSNADGAVIADSSGDGTIQTLDLEPTISIADLSMDEGDAGSTSFQFLVTLTNASYLDVSMDFTTTDGTATVADADYSTKTGSAGNCTGHPGRDCLNHHRRPGDRGHQVRACRRLHRRFEQPRQRHVYRHAGRRHDPERRPRTDHRHQQPVDYGG